MTQCTKKIQEPVKNFRKSSFSRNSCGDAKGGFDKSVRNKRPKVQNKIARKRKPTENS